MRKRILTYLASTLLAVALGMFVSATPASAGECFNSWCPGGDVWNNAPVGSIVISNCWKDSYGDWKEATTLDCQTRGDNRFGWPARTTMPRAWFSEDWSNDGTALWFADVDAVRFDRGCDTNYKLNGTNLYERRKGLNTDVWRKISSPDNVEIVSINCDYRVTNMNSAKCLAIGSSSTANGAEAIQWDCITTSLGQQWYIQPHPTSAGWVWIKNRHSDKCLAIGSSSTANGAEAIQWDCITTSNGQKWRLDNSYGANFSYWGYHLVNGSGKCLAIGSGNTANGANAIQWDCIWTSYSQRWGFFSTGISADPL